MNKLDRYILTNISMVKTQIIAICICYLLLIVFSAITSILFYPGSGMILVIVIGIQNLLIFKKLFYDSIYGSSAMIYNQLPVSPEQVVIGKLTALGIIDLIMGILNILMILSIFKIIQSDMLLDFSEPEILNILNAVSPYGFANNVFNRIKSGRYVSLCHCFL